MFRNPLRSTEQDSPQKDLSAMAFAMPLGFLARTKFTIRSNLHQARGTGVPPEGSENLSWVMAGTAMPRRADGSTPLLFPLRPFLCFALYNQKPVFKIANSL